MTDRNQHNKDISLLLAQIRDAFVSELPSRIDQLESLILSMREQSDTQESFTTLYRELHSLKGSAGTHGLHTISTICHNLEDRLSPYDSSDLPPDTAELNLWLEFIDLLRTAVEIHLDDFDEIRDIEHRLEWLRRRANDTQHRGLLVGLSQSHKLFCQTLFKEIGVELSIQDDGYQALDRLIHERFEVLVTSKHLPSLDGEALIAAVKISHGTSAKLQTILLTSTQPEVNNSPFAADFVVHKDHQFFSSMSEILESLRVQLGQSFTPSAQVESQSG